MERRADLFGFGKQLIRVALRQGLAKKTVDEVGERLVRQRGASQPPGDQSVEREAGEGHSRAAERTDLRLRVMKNLWRIGGKPRLERRDVDAADRPWQFDGLRRCCKPGRHDRATDRADLDAHPERACRHRPRERGGIAEVAGDHFDAEARKTFGPCRIADQGPQGCAGIGQQSGSFTTDFSGGSDDENHVRGVLSMIER